MSIEAITALVFVVIGNIIGWVYTYGKLSQKVENLQNTLENGLCEKVDGISRHLARLEGRVEGLFGNKK